MTTTPEEQTVSLLQLLLFQLIGLLNLAVWGFIAIFLPMLFSQGPDIGSAIYLFSAAPVLIISGLCLYMWYGYARKRAVIVKRCAIALAVMLLPALLMLLGG